MTDTKNSKIDENKTKNLFVLTSKGHILKVKKTIPYSREYYQTNGKILIAFTEEGEIAIDSNDIECVFEEFSFDVYQKRAKIFHLLRNYGCKMYPMGDNLVFLYTDVCPPQKIIINKNKFKLPLIQFKESVLKPFIFVRDSLIDVELKNKRELEKFNIQIKKSEDFIDKMTDKNYINTELDNSLKFITQIKIENDILIQKIQKNVPIIAELRLKLESGLDIDEMSKIYNTIDVIDADETKFYCQIHIDYYTQRDEKYTNDLEELNEKINSIIDSKAKNLKEIEKWKKKLKKLEKE